MTPPTLDTPRLSLRAHHPEDLADCVSLWSDPRVTRYIGGKAATREEVWSKMLRYAGLWALLGFGYWVVVEKSSGRFVGEVGLADFKRDIEPSLEGIPEAGWALLPGSHGKGYATEAVRAMLAWGDARLGSPASACIISPENTSSLRVADKCGYMRSRVTTYKGEPTVLYERS
jgi:RimJ/RimL family protein N-acetyltransferase